MALRCGVAAACLLAAAPVRAQDPAPAPPQAPAFRTEIVVTPERAPDDPSRLPVATAVLTRDTIARLPALTLADVLQALPGFQVVLGGSSGFMPATLARGFFDGGEAEYVKLLVDGIPVGDVESGGADWRSIPAFALDRLEALRGPVSGRSSTACLHATCSAGGVSAPCRVRTRTTIR